MHDDDQVRPLTPRQKALCQTVKQLTRDKGYAPTLRELGTALGIALTGSAVSVLYLVIRGGAANFSEAVDPRGFTLGLAGNCIIVGVLLGVITAVIARALRSRVTAG